MCCYGRTMTSTMLKKNEEIAFIKILYEDKVSGKAKQTKDLQTMVKFMLNQ